MDIFRENNVRILGQFAVRYTCRRSGYDGNELLISPSLLSLNRELKDKCPRWSRQPTAVPEEITLLKSLNSLISGLVVLPPDSTLVRTLVIQYRFDGCPQLILRSYCKLAGLRMMIF
ncbi:hypothetical protein RP20_CCG017198 [Aedes albopictus]|nr:hypothetical protein RP20_CCG017198 [Aedes albopictus]